MKPIDSALGSLRFPPEFVWGVATSAFQIEGAAALDGKGPSIWDRFSHSAGAIADQSNAEVACDHYHRWESDLDLIADLGVDAYRFSVSWPRVRPQGRGDWNEKGLDFYERLVDGLLERGVQPHLTLNHWDLPDTLQQDGGWANRDTTHRFVEYALGVNQRLGDRIRALATHNEPWVIATLGHETGVFAPGLKNRAVAIQVAHHLLLSHGMAVRALRDVGCSARLGIVLNLAPVRPATDAPADAQAALLEDGRLVRWYMDPLFKGTYPQDVLDYLCGDAPRVMPDDMAFIATPLDYLGLNYYSRQVVGAAGGRGVRSRELPVTEMGWEIYPEGLTELLVRLNRDYPLPPTYITENGGAFKDSLENGRVHDPLRNDFIVRHIEAVAEALKLGVPMAGYMVWSLLDNFEWASGLEKRFGIVHVDYTTLQRTLKDSALWYRDFLQARKEAQSQESLAAPGPYIGPVHLEAGETADAMRETRGHRSANAAEYLGTDESRLNVPAAPGSGYRPEQANEAISFGSASAHELALLQSIGGNRERSSQQAFTQTQ